MPLGLKNHNFLSSKLNRLATSFKLASGCYFHLDQMFSGDSRNVVRSDGEKVENTSHEGNLQDDGNYISFSVKDDLGSCHWPSFFERT